MGVPLRVVPSSDAIDLPAAERAARAFLGALGVPTHIGSTADTPRRMAAAYAELLSPRSFDLRAAVAGRVLLSLAMRDLPTAGEIAGLLSEAGAELYATVATHAELILLGIAVRSADEEGASGAARVRSGEFSLVVSTVRGGEAAPENAAIRRAALWAGVPCLTSVEAARACAAAGRPGEALEVRSLQRWEALARC